MKANGIGGCIRILDEVDSTNRYAKAWALEGAPHGAAVLAKRQSAGRGRRGRSWLSEEGGLYCSVVLRPDFSLEKAPQLTLTAALAVREAIQSAAGLSAGIKWPNDLLLGGKKVSGILTELQTAPGQPPAVIVGIGVNVAQQAFSEEVAPIALSLEQAGGKTDAKALFYAILAALEEKLTLLSEKGFSAILEEYARHSVTLGRRVRILGVDSVQEGVAEALDELGMLLLRKDDGSLARIASGDVSLRPAEGGTA